MEQHSQEELLQAAARIAFYALQLHQHAAEMKREVGLKEFIETIMNGTHAPRVEKFKAEQIVLLNKIIDVKKSINVDYMNELESIKDIKAYQPTTMQKIAEHAADSLSKKRKKKGFYDSTTFSHN